ncbi:MAG: 4-hydroxy-3-methylbut-2-en-1-yl diphosphate synthase [Campylobacteraceae bacterium]|jgi:hypothetical protein|nr:4-hydroxy-3-methylbut-2-en-1-yl diphosphate synthase [Campylobacteraceae bacterium]
MQKKSSKNYWPHGIIISLLLIVCACIYTIVEAVKYPVEMDTYYLDTKQNVDRNYDKIKAAQEAFEKKYIISFEVNEQDDGLLNVGDGNKVRILINLKDGSTGGYSAQCDFDANVELLLTRPETNKYNQNLTYTNAEKCRWFFEPFNIEKIGRWQFQTKITIGEDVGFFTHETNTTQGATL